MEIGQRYLQVSNPTDAPLKIDLLLYENKEIPNKFLDCGTYLKSNIIDGDHLNDIIYSSYSIQQCNFSGIMQPVPGIEEFTNNTYYQRPTPVDTLGLFDKISAIYTGKSFVPKKIESFRNNLDLRKQQTFFIDENNSYVVPPHEKMLIGPIYF